MMLRRLLLGSTALIAVFASSPAFADDTPLKVISVEFTSTPAPSNWLEMTQAYTRSQAVVTLADGTVKAFPLTYNILHRSGDYVGGWYAGLVVDKRAAPLTRSAPDKKGNIARGPFFAPGADGTSLIALPDAKADGVRGATLYLINHIEYETEADNIDPSKPPLDLYGALPMAMNLSVLDQDTASGALKPVRMSNVDFSAVGGLWIPCNGSTTPWMTHLGSEEYEPDAQTFEEKPLEAMNLYFGTLGKTAVQGGANPYVYGHLVEVAIAADGSIMPVKHYAMGRLSFELGDVMADRRTVYMGDDGDDVIRAMFVADKAEDLSSGTLYAAKWMQTDDAGFARADLKWIRLGHASDAEIAALIAKGIAFSDIWEVASPDEVKADPAKYDGFKPLYVYAGTGGEKGLHYYRLKPGMEQAAAFLETRRYAAWLGATSEFTKMEGQAHNAADNKLYTVISYVRKGMIAGDNKDRPQDDVHLAGDPKDLTCGVVYESNLKAGQSDSDGNPIASDLVAADMLPLVTGARQPQGARFGRYDKCNTDMVANPDNIRFSEAMRTLFIGEDSGNHLNNFVWAYNVDTGHLARILTAPAGGENTGLSVYDDINGHAYITGNVQHPGAEEDLSKYPPAITVDLRHFVDERGIVGYFSGLPAMTR